MPENMPRKACLVMLVGGLLAALLPAAARADQCDDMRAHISRLDGLIAGDSIQSSRNLRIQDRNNWANAYSAACSGGGNRGFSGSAPSGSGNRTMAVTGAVLGMLSILRDFTQQAEDRRAQEAYEAEQQRLLAEQQQAIEEARRQAEILENQRRKVEARARDDRQRQALLNPWAPAGSNARGNPFDNGPGALGGAARPAILESRSSSNPFDRPPDPPVAVAPAGGGFMTDEQIRAFCAASTNPSMCALAEQDARNQSPAYRQFRQAQAAQRERDVADAQKKVDEALALYRRQFSAAVIPSVGNRADVDRRGDGYDECRRGAAQPGTVVGCYEQPTGRPAATPASKRESLRVRVPRRLGGSTSATEQPEAAEIEDEDPAADLTPAGGPVPTPIATRSPPTGYRWETMTTEALCTTWGGRFFTPYDGGTPVCEVRDFGLSPRRADEPTRFTLDSSETDAAVRAIRGTAPPSSQSDAVGRQ